MTRTTMKKSLIVTLGALSLNLSSPDISMANNGDTCTGERVFSIISWGDRVDFPLTYDICTSPDGTHYVRDFDTGVRESITQKQKHDLVYTRNCAKEVAYKRVWKEESLKQYSVSIKRDRDMREYNSAIHTILYFQGTKPYQDVMKELEHLCPQVG